MRTSWWHSCQTLNPCWSWDILNFKTDFSFQTYQFWHLNVEEAKILLTCNQVHLLLLLLLGQICQHCTPPSSIIHSLHCKVVAWIGTYIVIVGYGSNRSSEGELWVFFFCQFSFASSIFCPFLFSSVNSKTEVKRERTQWHQFSAWLHQNIISKIHWFFWCLSILLPAVPRRETLLCPVLIWSVHDFIPIIVLMTSIIIIKIIDLWQPLMMMTLRPTRWTRLTRTSPCVREISTQTSFSPSQSRFSIQMMVMMMTMIMTMIIIIM